MSADLTHSVLLNLSWMGETCLVGPFQAGWVEWRGVFWAAFVCAPLHDRRRMLKVGEFADIETAKREVEQEVLRSLAAKPSAPLSEEPASE